MTDYELVALFLRIWLGSVERQYIGPEWFGMYTRERVTSEQAMRALELLRQKWERSLIYDDLLVRVARLESVTAGETED